MINGQFQHELLEDRAQNIQFSERKYNSQKMGNAIRLKNAIEVLLWFINSIQKINIPFNSPLLFFKKATTGWSCWKFYAITMLHLSIVKFILRNEQNNVKHAGQKCIIEAGNKKTPPIQRRNFPNISRQEARISFIRNNAEILRRFVERTASRKTKIRDA